jgi:O-antigen/teichoic acid export membrane protein
LTRAPQRSRFLAPLAGDLQIMMVGNGVEAAMRFAAFVAYSHALGPAGVGLVASVVALTQLASQVLDLGTDTSVISLGSRELGRGDLERTAEICRAGWNLQLWIGAGLFAVGLAAAPLLARGYYGEPSLAPTIALGFAGVLVTRLADLNQSILRTYQRFRAYALSGLVATTCYLGAIAALAYARRLSVGTVVGLIMLGGPLVRLVVSAVAVPRGILRPGVPPRAVLLRILGFGKWIYGTALAEAGTRRINVLFLQAFAGSAAAGYFDAASRYADFLSLIFDPLRKYLVPKFTALSDRRRIAEALRRTYRWLAWTVLLVPAAWLVIRPIVLHLQGEPWLPIVVPFRILVLAILVMVLARPLTYALFAVGRPHLQTWTQLALAAAFVPAAMWAIPRWGASGSAAAVLGMEVIACAAFAFHAHRALRVERDGEAARRA